MGSPEGTSYLRNVFNTLCNKIWFDSFVSCEVGGHSLRHNYIFHFKKESRTSGTGAKILRGSASCRQTAHRARRLLGITRLRDGFPKKKELFFWILFKLPQQFSIIPCCSWIFGMKSSIPDFNPKFSTLFLIEVNPPGIPSGRCHGRDLPSRKTKFNPRARAWPRGQGGPGLFPLSQLWLGCLWTSPGGPG